MRNISVVAITLVSLAAAAFAQTAPQSGGWVVLPVNEYRALRDKAYPPPLVPEPPPVNATISRVEYDLAVQNDAAAGQARLTVDVFKDGWVTVPIPAGLRVRDAKIDGRPVTLIDRAEGRSSPSVLLSRAGRSIVTLDLAVPIAAKSGVESIGLPASPSPVQRVSLALRSPDLALSVTGGFVAERTGAGQSTRFLVCGRPGVPLGLSWSRRRETSSAAQPLRLRGSVTELVSLAEDGAQVTAQIAVQVAQGAADRITLKLPHGFAVSHVAGADVGDWETRGDDLVVSFLEPVDQSASIAMAGEVQAPREGSIAVPLIRLAAAERETGGIGVEVLGAGEIKSSAARGLDAADPSELDQLIAGRQSPALAAFRARPQAWDAPRALEVTVARYTPQAVLLANIEEARYTALMTEDGKAMIEAVYAVRNSQRSFVAATLPESAVLWSASIDGRPVKPGRTNEGTLLLPILKDRAASGTTSIVRLFYVDRGARWASEAAVALRLPVVDLPVSRTGLQAYYSPRFRLTLEPGPFRVEPYAPPVSGALRAGTGYGTGTGSGWGGGMGAGTYRPRVEGGVAGGVAGGIVGGLPEAPPPMARTEPSADREVRNLVTEFQRSNRSGAVAGLLPIGMRVPSIGPSLYAAAELTPEGKAPDVKFTVKREVK